MNRKLVLLDLAPWPSLLSLVRHDPREWIVWGALPAPVLSAFERLGVEVRDEPLPRPFHRAPLPVLLADVARGVVVPALGHPLPSRWPIVRRLTAEGLPVFVARHGRVEAAPPVPTNDAFAWALDRLEQPPVYSSSTAPEIACVRADLLGDLLLTVPALAAAAEWHPLRLYVRQEWVEWMMRLLPARCETRGLRLVPWDGSTFDPAALAIDLSPPGWTSPLTPAIARAIPARSHVRLSGSNPHAGLSELLASELDLTVGWPDRKTQRGSVGVLVPTGSSLERHLPAADWAGAVERVSAAVGVRDWLVLDPDGMVDPGLRAALPGVRVLTGRQSPETLIDLMGGAAIVVGVSTALTHLAALTGTPAIVLEHPTTVPGLYRAPVNFVEYVRPARPWWRSDPTDDDVARALMEPSNSYGFQDGEWLRAIDTAIDRVMAEAFASRSCAA